jgi:integrase/recombinase XerD
MGEPSRVRVTGPLEPFAAGFIAELEDAGYRPAAAAVQVRVLAHLSRWMQEQHVRADELRELKLERFRREHAAGVASVRGAGLTVVLAHLRGRGVVPVQEPVVLTAADELLEEFWRYLTVERGLTVGTDARICRHRAPVRGVARDHDRRGRAVGSLACGCAQLPVV